MFVKPLDGEPLLLYLSISSNVASAILTKDLDEDQHPIYYLIKSLLNPETRYSQLEKIILALVTTSTKLRHCFETHTIHVKTNYPIKNVLRKQKMTGRMTKWSVKLDTHDIRYEPTHMILRSLPFLNDKSNFFENNIYVFRRYNIKMHNSLDSVEELHNLLLFLKHFFLC